MNSNYIVTIVYANLDSENTHFYSVHSALDFLRGEFTLQRSDKHILSANITVVPIPEN